MSPRQVLAPLLLLLTRVLLNSKCHSTVILIVTCPSYHSGANVALGSYTLAPLLPIWAMQGVSVRIPSCESVYTNEADQVEIRTSGRMLAAFSLQSRALADAATGWPIDWQASINSASLLLPRKWINENKEHLPTLLQLNTTDIVYLMCIISSQHSQNLVELLTSIF